MAREKKKAPAPTKGSQVSALARRTKRDRAQQYSDHIWQNLNPLKEPPKVKHKTYFESVENTEKKKKLEYKITTDRHPPPGFEFVATGNPDLTTTCKELSREQDAMIFIVSDAKNPSLLEHHMNRVGYHFRQIIVEQARAYLLQNGRYLHATQAPKPGEPEPIPEDQRDINRQADAVLRDLFPRIPNIDRYEIIQHAFKKDGKFHGDYKVGMAKDLTLARRVQLAALAYIRHTKTRYDQLLKETNWANARKAVEKPCLDIIVKWRGDEETGRDQLDEILREVIEISDSEDDSEDETSSPENASAQHTPAMSSAAPAVSSNNIATRDVPTAGGPTLAPGHREPSGKRGPLTPARQKAMTRMERRTARKAAQRFRRYAAVAQSIAHEHGQNGHNGVNANSRLSTIVDLTNSPVSHPPVRSAREAMPVAYRVLSPRPAASRAQLGPQPMHYTPSLPGEPIIRRPRDLSGDRRCPTTPALIRVSESDQPKVGPLSAQQQGHPSSAVSPITAGLQDLLLPSIEPRSPNMPDHPQYAFRTLHREYRDRTDAPRIVSRPVQPDGYISRPRSRPLAHDSDDRPIKRSRVVTYFPEDYSTPSSSSFVPLGHAKAGEGSRSAPFEYISNGIPVMRRVENARPDQPFVISTREYMPHDREEVLVRTRANPVMIDDSPYRSQRIFEVRDRPAEEWLGRDSPRTREVVYDSTLAHPRAYPVERVYHDERVVSNYRHDNISHNYVEPASRRLQDSILPLSSSLLSEAHRDINRVQPNYQHVQHRELPHDDHDLRQPIIERPGNIHRELPSFPQRPGRFEMRTGYARDNIENHLGFTSRPVVPEDRYDPRWHRPTMVREPYAANTAFSQGSRPFLAFTGPAGPAEYAEHRAPPPGHRVPQQETIWVD